MLFIRTHSDNQDTHENHDMKILVCWSNGKDSAWTLHTLNQTVDLCPIQAASSV